MENLPHQICDLCIVQLNVSYNFKRLALKNDFYMRNYLIENGISVTKDDMETTTTTTALEIHQIQHNVIRTNRTYRPPLPEIRRNSTTSSVSGASTLMIVNPTTTNENNFATPTTMRPPIVRPIQIKSEPIDPEESTSSSSSPAVSNTGQDSIVTVNSSNLSKEKSQTPMVSISSDFVKEISSPPAPLSVKLGRAKQKTNDEATKKTETPGYSPNGVKLGRPRKPITQLSKKSLEIQKRKENAKNAKNDKKLIKAVAKFVAPSNVRVSPRKRKENNQRTSRRNDKVKKTDDKKKIATKKKTQSSSNKKVKK